MPVKRSVYDFKVTLLDTTPAIWRRIQVPEKYTFWDLHVAIQDSMDWLDYHLHSFRFGKGRPRWEIGIPDDEGFDDLKILPGWEVPMIRSLLIPRQSNSTIQRNVGKLRSRPAFDLKLTVYKAPK